MHLLPLKVALLATSLDASARALSKAELIVSNVSNSNGAVAVAGCSGMVQWQGVRGAPRRPTAIY